MKKIKLKPCPCCGASGERVIANRIWFSGSIFDRHLFFVECLSCHWCGKTKLFLWRAKRTWNKEAANLGIKNQRGECV